METYKEKYNRIKKQEEAFIEYMLDDILRLFKAVWVKPITIGNMVYYYTEYNGKEVPAYCYLNDYENGDKTFKPIYDELNTGEFGWSRIEDVVKILDVIRDKFYIVEKEII